MSASIRLRRRVIGLILLTTLMGWAATDWEGGCDVAASSEVRP